jgi:hypothetical protein
MMKFFLWLKNKFELAPIEKYVSQEVHILELERIRWLSKMHHAMHMVAYHEDLIADMGSGNYSTQGKVTSSDVVRQQFFSKTTGVFTKRPTKNVVGG